MKCDASETGGDREGRVFPEEGSGAAGGETIASAPARDAGRGGALKRLWRDLRAGVRGSFFLPSHLEQLNSTPAGLALLALCDLLLNLALSFLLVGSGGSFSYSALPSFYFHLPLFLLLGVLIDRLAPGEGRIPGVAAALISLSIPIELFHAFLEWLAQWRHFERLQEHLTAPHYYRFFPWWCAASLILLLRFKGGRALRRVLPAILFLALVLPPLWFIQRGDLWVTYGEESESGELQVTEEVLAAQAKLLDQQLKELLPGRPGKTDLYFVGFAGDASQDVFLKELSATQRLFDQRFRTLGRSVLLVNNPQSGTSIPFATATNLERTLVRLREVMNPEDVLFLYLSSHGTRDHELEVNNPPLELKPLTPESLRRMLQKSGIAYKVVVVSACFSGGFLEPLKEEGSLVITAADATHESFGCGFGERFTWFGQAFVGDALQNTFSFTKAFERARETIGKWEEDRGETPSNPQIYLGKGIEPRLEALEKELEKK